MIIRKFTSNDYQDFAGLWNYAYPEGKKTAMDLMLLDHQRDSRMISRRWIAESDNKTVGVGEYEHWDEFYHPRKYFLHLIVNPEYQKNGSGSALYEQVINHIQTRKPLVLRAWALEGNEDSIDFLVKRDFTEEMRARQLTLDVHKYEFNPDAEIELSLKNRGIEIKTFGELPDKVSRLSQFHQIYCDSIKNMELPDKPTLPVLSTFNKGLENDPTIFDNHILALRNEEIIGICTLVPVNLTLYNEIIGVKADYQNHGIATILLNKAVQQACGKSYSSVTTYVRDHNVVMLGITKKLGFMQERGRILFQKNFPEN